MQANLTTSEVAEACGRSQAYISKQLSGDRPLLEETVNAVVRLAQQRMHEVKLVRRASLRALDFARVADGAAKVEFFEEAQVLDRIARDLLTPKQGRPIEIKTSTGYVVSDAEGRVVVEFSEAFLMPDEETKEQ